MKSIFSRKNNPSQQVAEPQTPHFTQAAPQVQAKMKTGAPDDTYEQEANSMARHMFGNISVPAADAPGKPASGQPPVEQQVQQSSGGAALPTAVRSEMEPAFGRDFSAVKVHTGPQAEAVTSQANAHALTYNNNIFYSKGQQPGVNPLTAHELTHVAQQGAPSAKETTQSGTQSKVTGSGSKGVTHSESPGTMRACGGGAKPPSAAPFAPTLGKTTTALKGTYGDYSVEHGLITQPTGSAFGSYYFSAEMTPNDKTKASTRIGFIQTVRAGDAKGKWYTKASDPSMDAEQAKRVNAGGWGVDRADPQGDKTPFYGMAKDATTGDIGPNGAQVNGNPTITEGKQGGANPKMIDQPGVMDPYALQFSSTAVDLKTGTMYDSINWGLNYDSANKIYNEETPAIIAAKDDRITNRDEAFKKWNANTADTTKGIDKIPGI